jgi:hypothetical protein
MKEEGQIPVSQCPDSGQEPLSIEDAKGPEEPATSTPPAVVTTSSTSIPSSSCRFSSTPFPSSFPVPEVSPYLAGVNSYPYLYPHFNPGYLSPQISVSHVLGDRAYARYYVFIDISSAYYTKPEPNISSFNRSLETSNFL